MTETLADVLERLSEEELRSFVLELCREDGALARRVMDTYAVPDAEIDTDVYLSSFRELFYDRFGLPDPISYKASKAFLSMLSRMIPDVLEPLSRAGRTKEAAAVALDMLEMVCSAPVLFQQCFIYEWQRVAEASYPYISGFLLDSEEERSSVEEFAGDVLSRLEDVRIEGFFVTEMLTGLLLRAELSPELSGRCSDHALEFLSDGYPGMPDERVPGALFIAESFFAHMIRMGKCPDEAADMIMGPLMRNPDTWQDMADEFRGSGLFDHALKLYLMLYRECGPFGRSWNRDKFARTITETHIEAGRKDEAVHFLREHLMKCEGYDEKAVMRLRELLPDREWKKFVHDYSMTRDRRCPDERFFLFMAENGEWEALFLSMLRESPIGAFLRHFEAMPDGVDASSLPDMENLLARRFENGRGRNDYAESAGLLKIMERFRGGKAAAEELAMDLRMRFAKRPSLMKVLSEYGF